jgi:Yip1 domain
MNIVDRIKNILLTPKTEWEVIAAETTPTNTLIVNYVLPLAAVAAIAGFIGMSVIGMGGMFGGTFRIPLMWGLVHAIFHVVMGVVLVFVLAFIIDALAPNFGSQKNMPQAIKVAAYSCTPVWVAGIVTIIPMLGILVLLAAIYAFYLLYLGLAGVMKSPQDKVTAYTAVVVVVAVILAIVISAVGGMLVRGPMGAGMMGMGMGTRSAPVVTYDPNSPVGKLNDFTAKIQEANKKMEAAQKSGDQKAQMAAAMGVLGTAVSGGKGVEPVQIDALKPFVPASFAGLPQTSTQSERGGVQGLMTAKVEAHYGDSSGKNAALEVLDTGGAAGLLGFASWMGVQGEREDDNRREVTRKDGNRLVHEEMSKRGGSNKFSVVLNERYVVSARGNVDFDTLKSSVASLDLGKLEALK